MSDLTKDQYIEALRLEVGTLQQGLNHLRDKARDGNASYAMYNYAWDIIKQQEYLTQIRRVLCRIKTASDGQAQLERLKEEFQYEILRWSPDRSTNPLGRMIAEAELAALKAALERLPESFAEEVQP